MPLEDMTHEITLHFQNGSVLIRAAIWYHGPGDYDAGIERMLKQLYPAAIGIYFVKLPYL
jgi:hypothetical protein